MKLLFEILIVVYHFKEEMEYYMYHYSWRVRAEFYSKHAHSPMSYMYIFVINFFNPLPYISCLQNFEGSNNFVHGEKYMKTPKEKKWVPISKIQLMLFM